MVAQLVKRMSPLALVALVWVLATFALGCPQPEQTSEHDAAESAGDEMAKRLAQYAPTELTVDLTGLTDAEREILGHLIHASDSMSEIFLRQVASGNAELREETAASGDADALTYFDLNFGPWDRLADMEPFLGDREHPQGAGYYPEDMSAEEFEQWLEDHPDDRDALTSLTTMVSRDAAGGLTATPYSETFRQWLEPAAERLRAAAALAENDSLARFLETRADAFFSDDYYESDLAWMDLSAPVEVTIGPYETYEDGLFGYKAAFESFLTVDVPDESAALTRYKNELPQLERDLPIADEHKNMNRGTESPIRVVDLLYTGGEASSGVATLAFNLPNDERVRENKGSKKVMLRNVLRAKYDRILVPIADRVLAPEDVSRVAFDSYFNQVLQHELAHGLGPGKITLDGRDTEVRLELKELYSTMEEAKADVMGVYNILQLMGRGALSDETRDSLEPTYVAGLFRSARFGVHEAHGQGVVAQFNYLLEKGALEVDEEGRFRTVKELFPKAIEDLLHEMLMLQANGDYDGTSSFLATYGRPSQELLGAIDRLHDVPVDIRMIFPQAAELKQAVR